MRANEILIKTYQSLYEQKDLLGEAKGVLEIDLSSVAVDDLTEDQLGQIEKIVAYVVSYLLGIKDVLSEDEIKVMQLIRDNYDEQEFWRDLLYDFVEYLIKKEREEIIKEEIKLLEESSETMKELYQMEKTEKAIIKTFADKIKKEGFRVDGEKLIERYLNMRRQDKNKAWEVLTTNPAFFAPIKVKDSMGVVVLKPEEAKEENKKLAKFLKHLKA